MIRIPPKSQWNQVWIKSGFHLRSHLWFEPFQWNQLFLDGIVSTTMLLSTTMITSTTILFSTIWSHPGFEAFHSTQLWFEYIFGAPRIRTLPFNQLWFEYIFGAPRIRTLPVDPAMIRIHLRSHPGFEPFKWNELWYILLIAIHLRSYPGFKPSKLTLLIPVTPSLESPRIRTLPMEPTMILIYLRSHPAFEPTRLLFESLLGANQDSNPLSGTGFKILMKNSCSSHFRLH